MPLFIANAAQAFQRAGRRWLYDYIEGAAGNLGTLRWQHIAQRWVMRSDSVWKLTHRDGGVMAATGLSVTINGYPDANTIEFLASWSASAPEVPYDDYEITAWTAEGGGVAGYAPRLMRQPSSPQQMHTITFSLRRKARTDGDSGGWTEASASVSSGNFVLVDGRSPA